MKKRGLQDKVKLNNGVLMLQHGFGVYKIDNQADAEIAISKALEVGYRSFDTAQLYHNEGILGNLLQQSGITRDELFITTKIGDENQGYDATLSSFEQSMKALKLDTLDLLLVHWPSQQHFFDTWRALERLYKEMRVRAIGVCNFNASHLDRLANMATVVPAVNQIECHPYLTQYPLKDYLKQHKMIAEAWSPLGRGIVLDDPLLKTIANSYHKSPAQVVLRWHLQQDMVIIPKSVTPSRIAENVDIYDFALSEEHMTMIDGLNRDYRTGHDPDDVYLKI
ncbi:aldo/keto reductase [Limnobaculum xujianqingii]|uniref:aldo/keto reductase n=1 Tax=Limnobaculum xujianqingii TaxID=2738837 RepID=UPI00112B0B7B|nr:aldo/keto reductase [Limnobaculum xujianqingii]